MAKETGVCETCGDQTCGGPRCRACANRAVPRSRRNCVRGTGLCGVKDCPTCAPFRVTARASDGLPYCKVCGSPVEDKRWPKKYCENPKCKRIGVNLQNPLLESWLDGKISADCNRGRHGTTVADWARVYMLVEADWTCPKCARNDVHPDTGLPPLEADHIDGDTSNNFRHNLRILCPYCHALTPTYRRMNQKYRKARREAE